MRERHPQKQVPRGEAVPKGSGGESLPTSTRAAMERHFGHDFGAVRIHADADAARSAKNLGALAYTLGRDVVFGAGAYAPNTPRGAALLAHELAHVVQQDGLAHDPKPRIGDPQDVSERAADAALSGSPALDIRALLRASAPRGAVIQRAVTTWGGTFDATTYTKFQDKLFPGDPNKYDGADIKLQFSPNNKVNATKIGMVQTVLITEKGAPITIGSATDKATHKNWMVQKGAGKGQRIDMAADQGNPLYATTMPGAADKLATTPTGAFWGHHYIHLGGKTDTTEAVILDTPKLISTRVRTGQKFETTALAVEGAQEGTYYGSVSWGWTKDNAAGKVTKLDLTLASNDVPTTAFRRTAEKWNVSKTSLGKDTIDLPIVDRQFSSADNTSVLKNPAAAAPQIAKIAKNTRVEVIEKGTGATAAWWKVTIVEGTHIGKVGWTLSSGLSPTKINKKIKKTP